VKRTTGLRPTGSFGNPARRFPTRNAASIGCPSFPASAPHTVETSMISSRVCATQLPRKTVAMLSPAAAVPLDRKGVFPSGRFYPAIAPDRMKAIPELKPIHVHAVIAPTRLEAIVKDPRQPRRWSSQRTGARVGCFRLAARGSGRRASSRDRQSIGRMPHGARQLLRPGCRD
jgi:hypothetical protein